MSILPRPRLELATNSATNSSTLPSLYDGALTNLLDINTVPSRRAGDPPQFIRAGGEYPDPWTRDAAINSWAAASALEPHVARDTLLMVCDVQNGQRLIAQDNQWWDQIIWVIAAWQHVLITGDREFLNEAFGIASRSAAILHEKRYRPETGLYTGGSVMQDGISGYPTPPNDPTISSSFVLDYPLAHDIMCLSTNAVYVEAYRCLGAMATAVGADADAAVFAERSASVAAAINEHLWQADAGTYGYFVADSGNSTSKSLTLDTHQEALGLAFAASFGVADAERARHVLDAAHREPRGIANVWPEFADRYDAKHPGRHSVICWPMVMGFFAEAEARAGMVEAFERSLGELTALFDGTDGAFFEIYNATSGAVDGGWQQGRHWESLPDQTWSATALIRLVHAGLFGLRYHEDGLGFAPTVPAALDGTVLRGLRYRNAELDITLSGHGSTLHELRIDGQPASAPQAGDADGAGSTRIPLIDATLTGKHDVTLEVR